MKLRGTRKDDTLSGGTGADVIKGLRGNDTLTGGGGGDVLYGGDGDDQLDGGLGSDRLFGGDGMDRLVDTANGSDTLFGGIGDDNLELTRRSETSTDVVVLHGDDGNDRLVYSGIYAAKVTATLSGDAGDDTIESNGSVTVHGGAGRDTITLQQFAEWSVVDAGDDDDSVSLQNDLATSNLITLGAGNDRFNGRGTFDVSGDDGEDTFSTINANGGIISGDAGRDLVDALNTEGGGLTIDTGAGNDFVSIQTSSYSSTFHVVTLGEGRDTLEMRTDIFMFDANVTVTDFDTGRGGDKLRLYDYLAVTSDNYDGGDPFASGHLRLEKSGSATLLQVDNDGGGDEWRTIVTFENTRPSAFRTANFEDGFDPSLSFGSPALHHGADLALATSSIVP